MGKYLVSNKNQKVNRTTRAWHIKHRQGAHTNFQQHKTIYTYVYIITYIRYDTITISSCYINVFKTDWRIVPISRPRTIYNIKQNYETNCRANLLPRLLASCPVEIRILENWGKNWKTLTLHRILGFACIWAPKADWGSHSKLWIRTLVNQHHCMPDKHSHEAKCSVSRSIRSPKCSYCVKLLGEHVKQTWTPSHYKSEWIFFCHPTSCQGSRTQRQVSKQQVGLHSLYIRFTLAIHWQYCKPKQTTSVHRYYNPTTVRPQPPFVSICHKHLLPWSHGPPWRRLHKGLVTAKSCAGFLTVSKSQHVAAGWLWLPHAACHAQQIEVWVPSL